MNLTPRCLDRKNLEREKMASAQYATQFKTQFEVLRYLLRPLLRAPWMRCAVAVSALLAVSHGYGQVHKKAEDVKQPVAVNVSVPKQPAPNVTLTETSSQPVWPTYLGLAFTTLGTIATVYAAIAAMKAAKATEQTVQHMQDAGRARLYPELYKHYQSETCETTCGLKISNCGPVPARQVRVEAALPDVSLALGSLQRNPWPVLGPSNSFDLPLDHLRVFLANREKVLTVVLSFDDGLGACSMSSSALRWKN
jgi:hypothetical protein